MAQTFSSKMWKVTPKELILKNKLDIWHKKQKKKLTHLKIECDDSSLDSDLSSNEKKKIKQKKMDINNYYKNKSYTRNASY